jgi:hypothetical protein
MVQLLKKDACILEGDLPPIIKPTGLSKERKLYLYKQIREFVADIYQDLVCPEPTDNQDLAPNNEEVDPSDVMYAQGPSKPPAKKPRKMAVKK